MTTPRVLRAPLALTVDGDMLLNVTELDVEPNVDAIAAALPNAGSTIFVGVALSPAERQQLEHDLAMVLPNVTGPIAGKRLVRMRRSR